MRVRELDSRARAGDYLESQRKNTDDLDPIQFALCRNRAASFLLIMAKNLTKSDLSQAQYSVSQKMQHSDANVV